jgi:hypothetical protein
MSTCCPIHSRRHGVRTLGNLRWADVVCWWAKCLVAAVLVAIPYSAHGGVKEADDGHATADAGAKRAKVELCKAACSRDGWCDTSPFGIETEVSGTVDETWQLVGRKQLFRKPPGKPCQQVELPDEYATYLAGAGGVAWLLSPRCRGKGGAARCAETTIHLRANDAWRAWTLPGRIYSVWAATPDDAWAVGGRDEGEGNAKLVYHWSGTTWKEVRVPEGETAKGPLKIVLGASGDKVWMAGGTAVYFWDGKELRRQQITRSLDHLLEDLASSRHTERSQPIRRECEYDDLSFVKDEVLIVPADQERCPTLTKGSRKDELADVNRAEHPRLIDRLGGIRFEDLELGSTPSHVVAIERAMTSVVKGEGGRLWVGIGAPYRHDVDGAMPSAISRQGNAWQTWSWFWARPTFFCDRTVDDGRALAFDGNTVLSLSSDSGFSLFEGDGWQSNSGAGRFPAEEHICSVWTAPGMPVFLGTMNGIERWVGGRSPRKLNGAPYHLKSGPNAIWASSSGDVWFSTLPCEEQRENFRRRCQAGLYHVTGKVTESYSLPGRRCTVRAIGGVAKDDVWLVGDEGCVAHYDGKRWSRVDSGTGGNLNRISACSSDEAWAVGDRGAILQWNGRIWQRRESGTGEDLLDVTGCLADGVWAVGRGGVVLVHEGEHGALR